MKPVNVIFFGSTHDSVIILKALYEIQNLKLTIVAVVTQPPRPIGRKHIITPTPVHLWATDNQIPVLHFQNQKEKPTLYNNQDQVIKALSAFDADLIVSASYGQLIPWDIIQNATYGGINIHPSLLPLWRGADPIPWTILSDAKQTGVSIVTLSEQFDEGKILNQQAVPVEKTAQREQLRELLFTKGASLLQKTLPKFVSQTLLLKDQQTTQATYARRLTKNDGFIPWELCKKFLTQSVLSKEELSLLPPLQHIIKQMKNDSLLGIYQNSAVFFDHAIRSLTPWPGVWTIVQFNYKPTRMNIYSLLITSTTNTFHIVQLEGKTNTQFSTIQNNIT